MKNIKADLARLTRGRISLGGLCYHYLVDRGFRAVVLFRLAHWLKRRGIRLLPALVMGRALAQTGAQIASEARIGPGLVIKHPVGLVVGVHTRMGQNCTLLQQVTLGEKYGRAGHTAYPILGDNVTLCAGAVVLGPVTLGDHVTIGANSVVTRDIPAHTVAVGVPARPLRRAVA